VKCKQVGRNDSFQMFRWLNCIRLVLEVNEFFQGYE
jgi:hypothetical protein